MGEAPHSRRTCVCLCLTTRFLSDVPDSLRSPSVEGDDGSFFALTYADARAFREGETVYNAVHAALLNKSLLTLPMSGAKLMVSMWRFACHGHWIMDYDLTISYAFP